MMTRCFRMGLVLWSYNGIVLGEESINSQSVSSPTSKTRSPSLRKPHVDIHTSAPQRALADLSSDGWSSWASDNFNGRERGAISCAGSPRIGFQAQQRYGLVDAKLECDDGTILRSTRNTNGRANPWMACNGQDVIGLRVNYQLGYGLVNAECFPNDQCPHQFIGSNSNTNGFWKPWLICPSGSAIDGIQVREQSGYGLVNLRIHCTSPVSVTPLPDTDDPGSDTCKWDNSLNGVLADTPLLITNLPVTTNQPFDDFSYMAESNGKDPTGGQWRLFTDLSFGNSRVQMRHLDTDSALATLSAAFNQSEKKAILFVIHGWNVAARFTLCSARRVTERTDYLAIPVIWNNHRGGLFQFDYRYDRVHSAPAAGMTLAELYKPFFHKIAARKHWMCHSMGCHVTQFMASDAYEAGEFNDTEGTKFDELLMVAPDLRVDIFNEYPFGAGKDKNECEPTQWKTQDASRRIPDCRPGGGDAIVGMVNRRVHVHWNPHDEAGKWRSRRLSFDLLHTWPLSMYGLLNHGPCPMSPLPKFDEKLVFIEWDGLEPKKAEHSYQFFERLLHYYNQSLNAW